MIVVHEDTAPAVNVPEPFRRTLKVLLSPAMHPELKALALGFTILPPGGKSDDHAHTEGEMFYVVAGTGRIKAGNEEAQLTPGTAIWSPPGESHQLINDGCDTLKILWVLCPPGREAGIIEKATQERRAKSRDCRG